MSDKSNYTIKIPVNAYMRKGLLLEKKSSTLLLKEIGENDLPYGQSATENYWIFG